DDGCHVYVPTQVQQFAQAAAAKAAGLPAEKVFIHTTFLGGGFGRRLETDFIPAAVEVAKAAQKPVKLLWTREDDTTHDAYRPPARDTVAGAFGADGRLNAFKLRLVGPSVTSRWAPSVVANGALDPFAVEGAHNFPYLVPNVYIDYVQHEVGFTVGYWRSVSHALNCFVVESFIDELAQDAREDPYIFRRNLLWKHKDPRWQGVLDIAARKADWGKAGKGRFQGIALMSGYDTYLAQVVEISVEGGRLKIHRIVCVVDCGQIVNRNIVEAQAEGSIVFGLTAALFGEINIEGGQVKERNFDGYRLLRMNEVPKIEVYFIEGEDKPGGMGEPAVALVAPALCNAIYAATGKRLRSLPIVKQGFSI
ncbi:MAG: xanthine dehydrogenase family protein molybdopterin-binding subunit, partial [Candidatus Obscuribacterales bacterium]|nr:xanthine dehydrogenase family protein molybdopterin-binding subunit [Steroidobacteraceae bacterium]